MPTYDTVVMVAFKLIDVSVGSFVAFPLHPLLQVVVHLLPFPDILCYRWWFICSLSPTSFVTGGEAITTGMLELILVFTCNKLTA